MATAGTRRGGPRLAHIDNLKTLMVAWIIGGHALLGYSATGGWAYDEVNEVTFDPGVELVLAAVLGPSGLYVIGVFFFVAGLFTPDALAHKGTARYIGDRTRRLGVPFLASLLLVWPLSVWVAYRAAGMDVSPWWVFRHREPPLDSGSLWFAGVLLVYSLAYAGWRAARPATDRRAAPLRPRALVAVAGVVAVTTFVVRLWWPARGAQPVDLHLWQWPQCAAMFALGMAAARRGWRDRVPDGVYRRCAAVAVAAIVLVPTAGLLAGVRDVADQVSAYLGGWSVPALGTATAEAALVVAGSVWLLGLSQRAMTGHGPFAAAMGRAAFAAYVAQGPVLMVIASALRPLALPAEVKAPLVGATAIAVCFGLGAAVTHRRKSLPAGAKDGGERTRVPGVLEG
ncbi:acyltransferase family protein [Actinokineospora sp. HUAS TT18]|uniref:acyltransferase family protein n=1 Tax=Actinokineospora sp. HUAS TT18 TaxID=3447451 RepID=UPI003F527A37